MYAISQLAEMGVILILFGVGLHFSLKDLWEVRRIAIPAQAAHAIAAPYRLSLTQLWGWSSWAGFVLGLAIGCQHSGAAERVVGLRAIEHSSRKVAVAGSFLRIL